MATLSLAVCWQAVAYYILGKEFGTFTSGLLGRHYIASFAMLTLPLLVYCFLETEKWYKFLFIPVALLDIDLLLMNWSRPAVLGITLSAFFILVFLTRGRKNGLACC
jgi:hypothetical protein